MCNGSSLMFSSEKKNGEEEEQVRERNGSREEIRAAAIPAFGLETQ